MAEFYLAGIFFSAVCFAGVQNFPLTAFCRLSKVSITMLRSGKLTAGIDARDELDVAAATGVLLGCGELGLLVVAGAGKRVSKLGKTGNMPPKEPVELRTVSTSAPRSGFAAMEVNSVANCFCASSIAL